MSSMKVAGKSPENLVTPISVSAEGNVNTLKVWANEIISVYSDESVPTSGTHRCTLLDLSEIGAVSLRVSNSSDQPITLGIYDDAVDGNYAMRNADGNVIGITVGAGKLHVMITPDEFPQLMWLKKLRLYFIASDSATTGKVTIYAVVKR